MQNQTGIEKDNALTRIARETKEYNAEHGRPAGRSAGAPVQALTGPRVTTRAMAEPEILEPEEQERLDKEARRIGILPSDKEEGSSYGSLEEALETASVPEPPIKATSGFLQANPKMPPMNIWNKVDAPRLINFKNVQGIDLENKVVQVDGFSIALPEDKAKELRKYAIELALDFVKKSLDEALAELTPAPEPETQGESGDGKESTEASTV